MLQEATCKLHGFPVSLFAERQLESSLVCKESLSQGAFGMLKELTGGVITVVIGGAAVTLSQADIASNLSSNTGMSQQEAKQYVNNIKESDLQSFSSLGASLIADGQSTQAKNIDCANYSYQWESATLSCSAGKSQLQKIGTDQINLGHCYQALGTDLGSSAKTKMSECVTYIDTVNANYNLPIAIAVLDSKNIADNKSAHSYNKSLLQAAIAK